jgi:hypothetical protein
MLPFAELNRPFNTPLHIEVFISRDLTFDSQANANSSLLGLCGVACSTILLATFQLVINFAHVTPLFCARMSSLPLSECRVLKF